MSRMEIAETSQKVEKEMHTQQPTKTSDDTPTQKPIALNFNINENGKFALLIIGFSVFIVLGVVIGLTVELAQKKTLIINPVSFCNQYTDCQGTRQDVRDSILKHFSQPSQIKALMQIARNMQRLATQSSDSRSIIFKDILKAAECNRYIFGPSYTKVYNFVQDLQINSDSWLQLYINMTQSMNGQQITSKYVEGLAASCNFSISSAISSPKLQNSIDNCSNKAATLFHVNAIMYSPERTLNNIQIMMELTKNDPNMAFDGGYIFTSAWRREGGLMFSIINEYLTILIQRGIIGVNRSKLLYFVKIILKASVPINFVDLPDFMEFQNFILEKLASDFLKPDFKYSVQQHSRAIEQNIHQGKKVVVIAHSEGTLYANAVYSAIESSRRQNVKMVFIGATASRMNDNSSRFITNPNDWVVNAVRGFSSITNISVPLPANTQSLIFQFLNHGFIGYITAYRTKFIEYVKKARQQAFKPFKTIGDGPISIQLSWNTTKTDLDLYIIEPSGFQVYYAAKIGQVGVLNHDDLNGTQPQHYYTKCDSIQIGTYRIMLNYAQGNQTTLATVRIKADIDYYTKTFVLVSPAGKQITGNPPILVSDIKVSLDTRDNSVDYRIRQSHRRQ